MGKRIRYKTGAFLGLAFCLLLLGCSKDIKNVEEIEIVEEVEPEPELEVEEEVENNSVAFQVVRDMKVGWNLGNTLDSLSDKTKIEGELSNISHEEYFETSWDNPVTTKEMIDTVAESGFGAIRVPVTYYNHMDENYQIREEWLDRVEEVVNYALDNNVYCIINLHHEEAWLKADKENLEENKEHLKIVWEQIAQRFKSYDEYLIFEGFNEIKNKEKQWDNADQSSYESINQLNQVFVDTIRESTEYNKQRCLIVNTYAAAVDQKTLNQFEIPKDTIEDHLIAQVHTYAPLVFSWTEKEVDWTQVRGNWKAGNDTKEIDEIINRLTYRFVNQGIPVIIGEFGAWNKENTAERIKYTQYIVSAAKEYDIPCFWWDPGGTFSSEEEIDNSVLLNRSEATWYYPEIVEALVEAAK